jgi:hypothetical protein
MDLINLKMPFKASQMKTGRISLMKGWKKEIGESLDKIIKFTLEVVKHPIL